VVEVIDVGVTGLIVDNVDQAILALPHVIGFDRAKVRCRFEERFLARRMGNDYVRVYRALCVKQCSRISCCPAMRAFVGMASTTWMLRRKSDNRLR
jgi:hypothetical protein